VNKIRDEIIIGDNHGLASKGSTSNGKSYVEVIINAGNDIEIRLMPITPSVNKKTRYVTNLLDFCSLIE
jgi:hypothetical protein